MNIYKCYFAHIPELGTAAIKKLLGEYGCEEEIYKLNTTQIERSNLLTERQKQALIKAKNNMDINEIFERITRHGMQLTVYGDEDYPQRLLNISNPPYQLFYYGQLPENNIPSVSIIGARSCSEYGKETAKYFGSSLAKYGVNVISGLASGVDGISQKAALDNGGKSYGVVGSGVDICYPISNRAIYNELITKGGVISEYPPGTKPIAQNFPMRNRIISGLSDIVLVVEAREKSGTSITVNMALEQGRTVYAVPGRINDALSKGCNRMIAEGAGVAKCIEDIIEELGLCVGCYQNDMKINKSFDSEIKKEIYKILTAKPASIDEIDKKLMSKMAIEELRIILFEMTFDNQIYEKIGMYSTY